jgi:prevent-host-death family protein
VGEASIRELRNHGGDVIARVAAGERIVVTRDGEPVAELRPLPRRPLTTAALIHAFGRLRAVDPDRLRADVDGVIDQSL